MTTPETTARADNPKLSAEEIGKRFLKLIEGLQSRNDISLERIRNVTGVSLIPPKSANDLYGYSGLLEEGWYYGLVYVPESASVKKGVSLDFSKRGESHADMTSVCGLDFDYYHNALKAMGFRDVAIPGEIGELRAWRYYRDDITLSIIPQNVLPGEAGRLCVKSIGTLN